MKFEEQVSCVCVHCRKEITGIRDGNGKTKAKCPHCGTVTVSQAVGRRHVQLDVYAPQDWFLNLRE